MTRIACPDTGLFALLPENSYRPEDIHWFIHESGFTVLQLNKGFSDRLSEVVPAMMEALQQDFDIIFVNLSHYLTSMEKLFVRLCDRTLVLMHNTHETLGDVTDAIRSSISIPAIFAPYRHKGRWMADGGLLNPVPVDVLLRKGADMVIAVCIEPRSGGRGAVSKAPGIIMDMLYRTISIVYSRATGDFAKNADIVLYPDVKDHAWDDFHKGISLMRYGMEECFEHLEEIKKMIRLKGAQKGISI